MEPPAPPVVFVVPPPAVPPAPGVETVENPPAFAVMLTDPPETVPDTVVAPLAALPLPVDPVRPVPFVPTVYVKEFPPTTAIVRSEKPPAPAPGDPVSAARAAPPPGPQARMRQDVAPDGTVSVAPVPES
jgi:hypothetical protein